jgi:methyltransferase (TIGR00027 family)
LISAISDTANWVAWYRALESARPDPLFRDPWAAALAGDRGRAIAAGMRGLRDGAGLIAVRTALIDRIVADAIVRDRIDTVLNLACGFDTRPFRLELPAHLRWFDIDGPTIIERKREVLKDASPRCRWHPLVADLADEEARRAALRTATDGAQRALVVTEGLLLYLHPDQVAALAIDLAAQPACTAWVTDLLSAEAQRHAAETYRKPFAGSGIAVRFGPEDSTAFFAGRGFAEVESQSTTHEAYVLRRLSRLYTCVFALMRLSARGRDRVAKSSRVVRLERRRVPSGI